MLPPPPPPHTHGNSPHCTHTRQVCKIADCEAEVLGEGLCEKHLKEKKKLKKKKRKAEKRKDTEKEDKGRSPAKKKKKAKQGP